LPTGWRNDPTNSLVNKAVSRDVVGALFFVLHYSKENKVETVVKFIILNIQKADKGNKQKWLNFSKSKTALGFIIT
jgi:hypothetical protein